MFKNLNRFRIALRLSGMTLFLFFLFFFFQKSFVFADQPKFSVTFDSTYKIADDGTTTVTQIFNAVNLTSDFALSEYNFKPGLLEFHNVQAYDQNGAISFSVNKEINLSFAHPSIGINNTYSWTLVYETNAIATRKGRLWNITIPKPPDFTGLTNFSSNVVVPKSFGNKIYDGAYLLYDPTGSDQSYESYNFVNSYDLANAKLYTVLAQIYLPRDTNFQKVFITDIYPRPIEVTLDQAKNWVATYQLGPASKQTVTVKGMIGLKFVKDQLPNNLILGKPNHYEVTPTTSDLNFNQQPKLGLRVDIPNQITAGFGSAATIYVENYGPTIFDGSSVSLISKRVVLEKNSLETGPILPFSTKAVKFNIKPTNFTTQGNDIIGLSFENEARLYNVAIKPFYTNGLILTVSILFGLGILSLIAQIARSLLLPKQKR